MAMLNNQRVSSGLRRLPLCGLKPPTGLRFACGIAVSAYQHLSTPNTYADHCCW